MSHENLPPRVAKLIMREIRQLAKNAPDGVTFVPGDEDCLNEIYAEIDGPAETPFYGGRFRCKLVIGSDFPMVAPKGYFLTKIYHPNVSETGEICVNALKKDWKPDLGIAHVLKVIWCLLLVPFPESSLNDEAGKLFMESYSEYEKKARIWTKIHALKNGDTDRCGGSENSASGGKKLKKKGSRNSNKSGKNSNNNSSNSLDTECASANCSKENGGVEVISAAGGLAPKEVNLAQNKNNTNASPSHSRSGGASKGGAKKIKKKTNKNKKKTLKRL